MQIEKDLIRYLEAQSKIELSDSQRDECKNNLQNIVSFIDTLSELDTNGVEPLIQPFPIVNAFREDEVDPFIDRELLLSNAPNKKDGYFKVPKTVD